MCGRKKVGQRIEPWGTPTFTRFSCKDYLSRTMRNHFLIKKDKKRANYSPELPGDLSLGRRVACQMLLKALDM